MVDGKANEPARVRLKAPASEGGRYNNKGGHNLLPSRAQPAAPLQQLQGVDVDEEGSFGDLFGVGVEEGSGEEFG
jgi:hypothetical protein